MMQELHTQIERISANFVAEIINAMKSAAMSYVAQEFELVKAPAGSSEVETQQEPEVQEKVVVKPAAKAKANGKAAAPPKRERATPEEVQSQKNAVLAAAKALKSNFSKKAVQEKTGLDVDLGRILSLLVTEGRLTKKGERATTVYSIK